eukprot:Skav234152  [mRNA]  locus=scaffold2592:207880:209484:+ [translate_table: standard]
MEFCTTMQPNLVTYSAAISACQSAAQWQEAVFLFGKMRSKEMLPNVITYSAVLSACDKGGQWERSLKLLQEMGESQVLPDSVACGAALSACERGLQWQLALHLLFSMPSAALKLDSICFSSVIASCSRSGRWKEVLNLVQDMLKLGVSDFSIARYEHVSQAGSTLDCFKHAVLVVILQLMTSEAAPLTCIDTHAGPALYDLGGNSQRGITRLKAEASHGLLKGYVNAAVRDGNASDGNPNESSKRPNLANKSSSNVSQYLGSPLLALHWLRPQDKAIFYEMSREAFHCLKENVFKRADSPAASVTLHQGNSYWHLAHQPGSKSRTLILMDPPYDPYETYMAWNLFLLQELHEKWPQSCIILWYPFLDDAQVDGLYHRLSDLDLAALVAEFGVQETQSLETSGGRGVMAMATARQ